MTYWNGDMILSVPLDQGHNGWQQSAKFNFSQVRGSHSLRAGVDLRQHYRTAVVNGGFTSGNFA